EYYCWLLFSGGQLF
nr:immunoglobulin light chain junction region [Macaca mulatta]MOX74688.1 immunoglobulin light chain junction region [Macaca mulatta]